jgi:hypothetical protein
VTPSKVFFPDTVENPLSLPAQLFIPPDFEFLLTTGGNLVDDEEEFNRFMSLLEDIGEREFYIQEHATEMGEPTPFKRTFLIPSNYTVFTRQFDDYSAFGMQVASWYVYGSSANWGIYVAEFPTINIIGCIPSLVDKFRNVFRISGSGYNELSGFVLEEFRNKELVKLFGINYKLDNL